MTKCFHEKRIRDQGLGIGRSALAGRQRGNSNREAGIDFTNILIEGRLKLALIAIIVQEKLRLKNGKPHPHMHSLFWHPTFRGPFGISFFIYLLLGLAGCDGSRSKMAALVSPAAGEQTCSPAPSLCWHPVSGAKDYWIQIARNRDLTEGVISDRSPLPRYVAPHALETGTYYWRVAAVGEAGVEAFSPVSSFTVLPFQKIFSIPPDADLAAMQKIIAAAAGQAPARVVFAPGAVYRIHPESVAFVLKEISGLELDGNGATLIFTNPTAGFLELNRCSRITVRNFIVDFDPVPFSVGTVRSVDLQTGSFTLTADPGMPEFDAPHMLKHWLFGVTLDPSVPGRMKTGSFLVVGPGSKVVRTEEQIEIPLKNPDMLRTFAPGDKYVQFARKDGHELIRGEHSSELAFLNNTTYAAPAGHYVLLYCDDAKVLGCRELIRPGRWFGGNADGVHVRSSEIGPWVEGCTIEGIGDDGVAIYSKGIEILEKPSDTTLRLDDGFFTLHPGSQFLIFDPNTGTPVVENLTVKSVTEVSKNDRFPAHKLVEFSPGFSQAVEIGFKEAWKNNQVFDRTAQHHQFMVRRNVIRQVRRYGAIIRAVDGAVEENEITQTSDSAITLQNEPYFWKNGLQSENILIQNNVIRDCNFTQSAKNRGSINVLLRRIISDDQGKIWKDAPSRWQGHRNITIRNNSIRQWQQRGISVQSAKAVRISGNRIEEVLPNTLDTGAQYGIYLENVEDATVENNSVSPLVTEEIKVVDCGNVRVTGNTQPVAKAER